MKRIASILLVVALLCCLSVSAFAEDAKVTEDSGRAVTYINASFTGNTCTVSGISEFGGYAIIRLNNIPTKKITCTISGSPNLHYEVEYLYIGYPAFSATSNQILGNGSTTNVVNLAYWGDYYVSISPFSGVSSGGTLTLTFKAK